MDVISPTELPPAKKVSNPGDTPHQPNKPKGKEKEVKEPNEMPVTMDHFDKQMSEMEARLSTNITASVTAGLKSIIDSTVKEALETIKKSVDEAIESNPTVITHGEQIDSLETENLILKSKVQDMEGEHKKLKNKIDQIENRALQHCLIVKGIAEEEWEKESTSRDKVYKELEIIVSTDHTFDNRNEENKHRLKLARKMEIRSCKCLGRYNKDRSRPISIELLCKDDVDFILSCKSKLRKGIYIDKEYPIEIERKRKVLRPILTVAKKQKKFRKKCKMEKDELVIKGKHYNINTLTKLPKSLKPSKVSSRTNDHIYGYFGELNPLSNIYRAPFTYNSVHYHCSEQFIQHEKAKLFDDKSAMKWIMEAKNGSTCKEAGRKIKNFKHDKWAKKAKSLCLEGIKQKYLSNAEPWRVLLSTKDKTIAECTKDNTWGCGLALSNDSCLDKTLWTGQGEGQGIMGELLESIRETIRQQMGQLADPITEDDDSSTSTSTDMSSESEDNESQTGTSLTSNPTATLETISTNNKSEVP